MFITSNRKPTILLDVLLVLPADVKGWLTKQQQMFICHITQSLTFNFGHSCRCQAMTQGLMFEPHTLFFSIFSFIKSPHLPLTQSGSNHKAWLLLIIVFFLGKRSQRILALDKESDWKVTQMLSLSISNLCFTPALKACLQNWNLWNGVTTPHQTCEHEAALC